MRRPALFVLMPLFLLASQAWAGKTWLQPPSMSWEEIRPYVHANVVPFLTDEGITVSLCTGTTERSVAHPFDEDVSQFVKLMLLQLMYRDDVFSTAVVDMTQTFRERLLSPEEREDFRALYWEALDQDQQLQARMRAAYDRARTKGRLHCWLCDKNPNVMVDIEQSMPK